MAQAEPITVLRQVQLVATMVRVVLTPEAPDLILHGVEIHQDLKVEFKAERADQVPDTADPAQDQEVADSVNNFH